MGQGIVNLVGREMSIQSISLETYAQSQVASPLNFWNKQCKR